MDKKNFIVTTITVIIFVLVVFIYKENYYTINGKIEYVYRKYFQKNIKQYLVDNDYKKEEDYEFVKINKNTKIKNINQLKNAIYTYLDSGWDKYIITCDVDYLTCTTDVKKLVEDKNYLTNISNYVHPFNTFNEFNTSITASGKITFKKEIRYTDEQIDAINKKVEEIYNKYYDKSKTKVENIKIFHDYIINNTKYDKTNKNGSSKKTSSNAYGVLIENIGICSGYSDAMSLFLDKLNIKNYRISSDNHMWNIALVEGVWKHIDLTWDDPINSDGSDTLSDKYLLITTDELNQINDGEHSFDLSVYKEANN